MFVSFQVALQAIGTVRAATFRVDRVDKRLKTNVTYEVVVYRAFIVIQVGAIFRMTLEF